MKNRLLVEQASPRDGKPPKARRGVKRPARTVTVNLAESPLGWLLSRGIVSARQFAAGETLRADWERSGLGQRVTMCWDSAPPDRNARGPADAPHPTFVQVAARRRFDAAVATLGPGLRDVLWRVVCAGEGMRDAEQALGWPARAGKLVLGFALDRLADHYRLR